VGRREYSDEALAEAIAAARSWRGVLRHLGLSATSAGSLRAARRRATELDLDYSHFSGNRRWSDQQLAAAIATANSWSDVAAAVGRSPDGGALASLRTRALRLGLEIAHLEPSRPHGEKQVSADAARLREAAPLIAAAWFTLRGFSVSWPLEPRRYDLVVERRSNFQRVQVKSTTWRDGSGFAVSLSNSRRGGRAAYSTDEIDSFFVVDQDLTAYLIPVSHVAGYQAINLRNYEAHRVTLQGQLLGDPRIDSW
jgi:hypothetical protein